MTEDFTTAFVKMLQQQALATEALEFKKRCYGKNGGSVARQKREARKRRNKKR